MGGDRIHGAPTTSPQRRHTSAKQPELYCPLIYLQRCGGRIQVVHTTSPQRRHTSAKQPELHWTSLLWNGANVGRITSRTSPNHTFTFLFISHKFGYVIRMLQWYVSILYLDCSSRSFGQSFGRSSLRKYWMAQVNSLHTFRVHGTFAISKVKEVIAPSIVCSIWDIGDTIPVRVEGKVHNQVQSTAMLSRSSRRSRGWLTSSPASPLMISPRVIPFFFTPQSVVLFLVKEWVEDIRFTFYHF